MPLRFLLPLCALTACTPRGNLKTVPIQGATEAEERVLYNEIAIFNRATGYDISLSRIDIDPTLSERKGLVGRYRAWSRRITLMPMESVRSEAYFRRIVRHELCHAVDDQWDDVGFQLGMHHLQAPPGLPLVDEHRPERIAGERFAQYCELGGYQDLLLAHSPDVTQRERDAASGVIDAVWGYQLPRATSLWVELERWPTDLEHIEHAAIARGTGALTVSDEAGGQVVHPRTVDPRPGREGFYQCQLRADHPDGSRGRVGGGCASDTGQISYDDATFFSGTLLTQDPSGDGWAIMEPEPWFPKAYWLRGPSSRLFGVRVDAGELVLVEVHP